MLPRQINGIVTPVITPLLPDGTLDVDSVRKHQNFLIDHGIAAIFVLGTTGEGPALPDFVRKQMIVASSEVINHRVPLLVGISSDGLEESLELARFAASHGADAVVAAPPCYFPYDHAELLEFYRILTTEQPLPLFIYNMPAMTKINMPPELIIAIAGLPGVVGYKDSAGDFEAFKVVAGTLKDRKDFSLLMGPDALLGQAVTVGACGGVNSGSNIAPEYFINMLKAAKDGNANEIDIWQKEITGLQAIYQFRENICCGVAAGLKKALSLMGLCTTTMTRPARPMEDQPVIADFVRHYQGK